MATIKQSYSSQTLDTTGLDSLTATTGVVASAEVDNTSNLFLAADITFDITSTAATTKTLDVYLMRSNTTGTYGDTTENSNHTFLCSINPAASDPVKTIRVEQLPKYWKLLFKNTSDAALGTSNVVSFEGVALTNA